MIVSVANVQFFSLSACQELTVSAFFANGAVIVEINDILGNRAANRSCLIWDILLWIAMFAFVNRKSAWKVFSRFSCSLGDFAKTFQFFVIYAWWHCRAEQCWPRFFYFRE